MKVSREILDALRETGLPFEVRDGGKHLKLYMNEKMIGVVSKRPDNFGTRGNRNTIARIKRWAKIMKATDVNTARKSVDGSHAQTLSGNVEAGKDL